MSPFPLQTGHGSDALLAVMLLSVGWLRFCVFGLGLRRGFGIGAGIGSQSSYRTSYDSAGGPAHENQSQSAHYATCEVSNRFYIPGMRGMRVTDVHKPPQRVGRVLTREDGGADLATVGTRPRRGLSSRRGDMMCDNSHALGNGGLGARRASMGEGTKEGTR